MPRTTRTTAVGLALMITGLTLSACGDATAPDPLEEAALRNAALVAADATLEDVTLATTPFGFGIMGAPEAGTGAEPSAMGEPGGHRGIGGSLSGTRSVTFYDAEGNEQTGYDPLTTASIHFILDISGEVSRDTWSATVDRSRDMTVSGLEGEETTRTFNGTGSQSVGRSHTLEDGTESTFDIDGSASYADLMVPVPGSDPRYPLSGTITRDLTVTVVNNPRGNDFTKTVHVEVTFDGTSTAHAVINGEATDIDLTTRPGGNPFRGGRFGRQGG
ncbi:MAG: hypothetical protein PVJ02_09700 [Gemmatimonadota bacterium]|jgi:hypothetical protein